MYSYKSVLVFVQEHLPYADDSNAVTPMSEENGAMVVPIYYANLGSRHSSYTSHASHKSYTSHGDLLGTLKVFKIFFVWKTGY